MQIMDTSPNLVFLQEYNEKQIKQQGKKEIVVKSLESRHQVTRVVTSVEEYCDIISESRHCMTKVTTFFFRVTTSSA